MQKYTSVIAFLLVVLALGLTGLIVYHQGNTVPPQSTFTLSPTPNIIPTPTLEPVITNWSTYTNDAFNFTIDYPTGWNQQEYTGPYGAKVVAFSQSILPCKDCTYVHDGFYSIKIFTQTTDPQAYTDFTTTKQSVGKSPDSQEVQINGKPGILFGNTVAVENNGYVYETSLDIDNGTHKAADSSLFQKAATSLQFTNLIFNK